MEKVKPRSMFMHTVADRQRMKTLIKRIKDESHLHVSPYVNSKGRVILNVTDPRERALDRISPFVVRDEAEWDEKKPARKSKEGK